MKILSLETSAKSVSAAVTDGEKLLAYAYQATGLTHSRTLMPMVEAMLKNSDLTLNDMEAIAVSSGPGSFTGLRIGVAAAKGLAWAQDLPCCGVSTLEAMARNLGVYQGYVVPAMDARRSQVYTAIFHADKGELTRVEEDMAISLAELGEKIKNFGQPVFLVGDGATLCYNTLLEEVPGLVLPKEHRMHQRAAGVALAAQAMADAGDPGNGAELTPNYLRLSQAERERLARENR